MDVGCGGSEGHDDLRYHTPQATVHTLLEAYGILDLPQKEIDRRMDIGRRFHLSDPEARRLAFADWDEPADEGLAGYVFGNLARAKDSLRISITEDVAHVRSANAEVRIRPVVLQEDDIGWRIVLEDSVPPAVARDLRQAWEERAGSQTEAEGGAALPPVPSLPEPPGSSEHQR
jgi:hypothetical protein